MKGGQKMAKSNLIGAIAFLLGVILAVIFGAAGEISPLVTYILVVLGLLVGLLNITDKEATTFLMSAVALVIVSSLSADALNVIPLVSRMFNALLVLFVPATVIVALKAVFTAAKG